MKTAARKTGCSLATLLLCASTLVGCSPWFWGGAAAGAAGSSAAYERENKQALEHLDKQFRKGKITREEYLRRKREIDERSLIY